MKNMIWIALLCTGCFAPVKEQPDVPLLYCSLIGVSVDECPYDNLYYTKTGEKMFGDCGIREKCEGCEEKKVPCETLFRVKVYKVEP